MKITQNGMACCSVVVGRDATWLEHHTAQELRSYIQKISGAVLLVVPEHDAQSTERAGRQDSHRQAGHAWYDSYL